VVPGGGEWVYFPSVRHGKVVNRKYRRLDRKDFRQDRGGEQCWWNHDCLLDEQLSDQTLVVTEGEIDALTAIRCGFARSVSVPNGAPARELAEDGAKYAYLADTLPLLRGARNIVLATDGDPSGVALMNDLAVRLGKGRCRYVEYPDGCKDLNDVLVRLGPDAVVAAVNGAKWVKVVGLHLMSRLPPVEDAEPIDTGMPGLAPHYRVRRGDFCVVTGVPGAGKSTWVNDLACNLASKGLRTCFASFEQHPQIDHKRALIRWFTSKTEGELTHREILDVYAWMDRSFSFVIPDDDEDASLEWILDKLAAAVVRYGANVCVVDPWNELDHDRPRDMTTTEYVGQSIRQMKKFAKIWNVHLIVVAHPTKLPKDKDGIIQMPTLYDISDSANWYNKPDVGIVIHQDMAGTLVRVAKSRYHDSIGKPGTVVMRFNSFTNRYEATDGPYLAEMPQ
jgi:twinkle protein